MFILNPSSESFLVVFSINPIFSHIQLSLHSMKSNPLSQKTLPSSKPKLSNTHVQTLIKNFLLNVLIHYGKIHIFFIKLPFKLNEDINPTKASHSGMNPEHKLLAQEECAHLQAQGLIEPTNSPWSCEAFYVNKRSEQKHGKLWLVINYQPLNHFLQDDKFPLPNTMTLFSCLHNAKVFSKFDLKAGFWQLDIHPEDRYKTGICIPDHHYQWRVMSFGLKVAPSLFQKVMIKVFEPMLPSALVYIDDVLLFSKDEESHAALLQQFAELVHQHGIMLLCYNNLPSLSTNMASCFLKARCSSVKRKLSFLAWFLRMVLIHLAPISLKNFKSFQMAPSRESKSNNFWALSNISEILFLELHR